jgi:hypothetical protein
MIAIEECGCASPSVWDLYFAAITAEWAVNIAACSGSAAEQRAARAQRDRAHAIWCDAVEALTAAAARITTLAPAADQPTRRVVVVPAQAGTQKQTTEIPGFPLSRE